jgi:hypothetical protein
MGFVRKIGRKIDDAIIQPVLNTVEAVIEDPKKLLTVGLSVLAPGIGTALGGAMGLSGTVATLVGNAAVNTALNGGDIKAGIMAAAIPVVGKELAGTAASAFIDSGMDKALAESAGKVVAGTGIATVQGKDPLSALISGGLSEGTAAITRDIPGFGDLPEAAKRSINAAVATELAGGDGTQSAINAAMNVGINSLADYTNSLTADTSGSNQHGLIEGYFQPGGEGYIAPEPPPETAMPSPDDDFMPTLPSGDSSETPSTPGYYNEITGEFVPDENGGLRGPLGPETGNIDPDQKWEYSLTKPGVWTNDQGEEIDLSYMPDRDTAMTGKELMERAGAMPGGIKSPAKGPAKPTTPGAKTPATGTNPAVDAITNLANQQQQYQNSVLNMMMNDKNEVANIKSFKDLYGEGLFGDTYVPPSALGNPTGFAQQPQFQNQGNDVEDFFKGGDVTDINTLLQILRD